MSRLTNVGVLSLIIFVGILVVILGQALNPRWNAHLQMDVKTFQNRSTSFFENNSWKELGANEYQPAALWWFVLNGIPSEVFGNREIYLHTFIIINIVIATVIWLFFVNILGKKSGFLFSLILLATGPILLFRFELLTSLLVILAWFFMGKRRFYLSVIFLSLAVGLKLYPLILLPFLLGEVLKRRVSLVSTLGIFLAGLTIPVVTYLLLGGTVGTLIDSIRFHQLKSIGMEGIWGNLLALTKIFAGIDFTIISGYGVHGVSTNVALFNSTILDVLPIAITSGLVLLVLWKYRKVGYSSSLLAFSALAAFTIPLKVLNPQYLWWFLVLVPFVLEKFTNLLWYKAVVAASVLSLALTQYIYPLNYSEFLLWFRNVSWNSPFLIVLTIRNICLLVVLVICIKSVWSVNFLTRHN